MTEQNADVRCEALAPRAEVLDISPKAARDGLQAIRMFQAVVREVLTPGTDFGTIPGCGDKPTLLKPGAEKIAKLLKCYDDYEFVEKVEDWDRPLFHYLVRCTLSDMATGTRVSSGMGEANSFESKHRFRWITEDQLPLGFDKATAKKRGGKQTLFEPAFAISKKETTGQYGKPEGHWAMFEAAIANKTARAAMKKTKAGRDMAGFEVDVNTMLYQVPNPDIYDIVNTLVKMAKKRALVDATLSAGRLSELFTQDIEDFADVAGAGEPAQDASKAAADAEAKTKEQAEYEASKKVPLKDIKDEFTNPEAFPEGEAGPAVEGLPMATMAQLAEFVKAKDRLAALGINEQLLWTQIHKHMTATFKKTVVETSDFSELEMADVLDYLKAWEETQKGRKAAKAKGGAK